MKTRTSRTNPEPLKGKEYEYSSFAEGKAFPEKKTGLLPAMGWNSWNAFGSGNTEELAKMTADKFKELELDKLGYEYIVLDDGCYCPERADGKLTNEPVKFPSGFKALGDYIHEKGLKFGMYNDVGTNLCAGAAVGTCGFEDVDAKSYAEWGVDFLKVDNCYYLWDNATFSKPESAKYTFAPKIKGIRITGHGQDFSLRAADTTVCELTGSVGKFDDEGNAFFIGTTDGTNVGTTPVGEQSSELVFYVNTSEEGLYDLFVTYATAQEVGQGEWLQIAVTGEESGSDKGLEENDSRIIFDGMMEATPSKDAFTVSGAFSIKLCKGENEIALMNHRRQENTLNSYAAMFYALKEASPEKDILLSMCEWGKTNPQNWGYKVGASWRILNDITFCVGRDGDPGRGSWNHPGTQSICSQYNKAVVMDEFSGLDRGWNDPDMMVIGMNDITRQMSETHMVMWCMLNSPLMLGLDLRRVQKGDELYKIIANKDLIALNQDALGIQAKRVFSTLEEDEPDTAYIMDDNRVDVLFKPLSNGDFAVSFINLSTEKNEAQISVSLDVMLDFAGHKCVNADKLEKASKFMLKNLITGGETVQEGRMFSAGNIEPCGNVTFRVSVC